LRELEEETGIEQSSITEIEILGYARLLHYGGKPDYFGIAIADVTKEDLSRRWEEMPFVREHELIEIFGSRPSDFVVGLESKVDELRLDPECSIVLLCNVIFALGFLKGDGGVFADRIFAPT
ncbi:MAG: hypothetical protein AAGE01_17970, partial [Pseudomonadota bacterium]